MSDTEVKSKGQETSTQPNEATPPEPKPWTQERLDKMRDTVNELVRIVNKSAKSDGHDRRVGLITSIMTLDTQIARLTDDLKNSVWMSTEMPTLHLQQAQEHRQLLKRELDLLYPPTTV